MDFGRKNGAFDPTTAECCPNVDFVARKALRTEKSVSALMAWPSREGWLHGVKFLFVQGGAEGIDECVLVMAHDALSCKR